MRTIRGASRSRRLVAVTLFAGALASGAGAAVFTVGAGADCTHPNISFALLASAFNGPATDTIRIANDQTYSLQANVVSNQSVTLIGGYATCSSPTPGVVRPNLSGAGGIAAPVFAISNTTASRTVVSLMNLRIASGDASGITVAGDVSVFVENSLIDQNSGGNGGGIAIDGTDEPLVSIDANSKVRQNGADYGGGLYCDGAGIVVIQGELENNTAVAHGGGVYLANGCFLIATSTDSRKLFYQNDAASVPVAGRGGAIYAASGASALLFGGGTNPLRFQGNSALEGGAIYLTGAGTAVEMSEVEMRLNVAEPGGRGGAVAVGNGAELLVHRTASNCAAGVRCNLFELNGTSQGVNTRENGGAFWVFGGGHAIVRQSSFDGNQSADHGSIGFVEGAGSLLQIESAMIRTNPVGTQLSEFLVESNGLVRLAFTTTDANLAHASHRMFTYTAPARVEVFTSVFSEALGRIFELFPPGVTYQIDCVLSRETVSFPWDATETLSFTDPATVFVNQPVGDLHLVAGSPAIDSCDTFYYSPLGADIDGEARGFQDPSVPDHLGPYDRGADERQGGPPSLIFADSFESGDFSAWAP